MNNIKKEIENISKTRCPKDLSIYLKYISEEIGQQEVYLDLDKGIEYVDDYFGNEFIPDIIYPYKSNESDGILHFLTRQNLVGFSDYELKHHSSELKKIIPLFYDQGGRDGIYYSLLPEHFGKILIWQADYNFTYPFKEGIFVLSKSFREFLEKLESLYGGYIKHISEPLKNLKYES